MVASITTVVTRGAGKELPEAVVVVDSAGLEKGTAANPNSFAFGPLSAGTDRSGSITTGGTAQVLAAANTARVALRGQNISSEDMWINEVGGTATANTAGSDKVGPGGTFDIDTNRAISIVAATTGSKFTAVEI